MGRAARAKWARRRTRCADLVRACGDRVVGTSAQGQALLAAMRKYRAKARFWRVG